MVTPDGVRLAAWCFDPPAGVAARGTVVLGHGYRDDRRQLTVLAPALSARGLRVIAMDFRGHGESGGDRITLGVAESRDVDAAIDTARSLGGPVGYVGFSMGAAAYLLAGREADAAVLDSPYDTLTEAVGARLDRFFIPRPVGSGLVRYGALRVEALPDSVRPIDRVPTLMHPTLFVFGARDPWLPAVARQRFRTALAPQSTMEEIPRAGHADHFDGAWITRVASFLDGALTTPASRPRQDPLPAL